MEKTTYYVSVQAETVLDQKEDASFEFEIKATLRELDQLTALFEEKADALDDTFQRTAFTPFLQYHHDHENDVHDKILLEIYKMIHSLGTEATKKHIESMGIVHAEQLYPKNLR